MAIGGLFTFVLYAAPDGKFAKKLLRTDEFLKVGAKDWRRRQLVLLPILALACLSYFLQKPVGLSGIPLLMMLLTWAAQMFLARRFEKKPEQG